MGIMITLEPLDILFFRDNRPFSAGEDFYAESTLPSPLTVFGAIGNYILQKTGTDLKKFFTSKGNDPVLGEYDNNLSKTNLRIKGPFFLINERVYFHPPANLFYINGLLKFLTPRENIDYEWDIELPLKPIEIPGGDFEPVECFISEDYVNRYLTKNLIFIPEVGKDKLYFEERRFGHKLSRKTMAVERGFLYSVGYLRFIDKLESKKYEKSKIVVFVDGIEDTFFTDETIFIGGERKIAFLEKIDKNLSFPEEEIVEKAKEGRRFFLYFVTPSIFSKGFYRETWPQEFQNVGARLVGIAVNKPLYLSGWRRTGVSSGYPRPIRKAVPAGSVYFFECDNKFSEVGFRKLYDKYNFNGSLSEEYPCAGFGIALIGVW